MQWAPKWLALISSFLALITTIILAVYSTKSAQFGAFNAFTIYTLTVLAYVAVLVVIMDIYAVHIESVSLSHSITIFLALEVIALFVFSVMMLITAAQIDDEWQSLDADTKRSIAETALGRAFNGDISTQQNFPEVISIIRNEFNSSGALGLINTLFIVAAVISTSRLRIAVLLERKALESDILRQVEVAPPVVDEKMFDLYFGDPNKPPKQDFRSR